MKDNPEFTPALSLFPPEFLGISKARRTGRGQAMIRVGKDRTRKAILAVFTILISGAAANQALAKPKIMIFDPEGAYSTSAQAINNKGLIAGAVLTDEGYKGFVRSTDGTMTSFGVPGINAGTLALGINRLGQIAGEYDTASRNGFIREADSTFVTFDVRKTNSAIALSINDRGTVAGFYFDSTGYTHGFVRGVHGKITPFDVPGSVRGTIAYAINNAGVVTGSIQDGNGQRGFVRNADGTISTFTVGICIHGTYARSLNDQGTVVGYCYDESGKGHAFLRAADGTFTTFDAPGGGNEIEASSINNAGAVTGRFTDTNYQSHGFVREPDGTTTVFDPVPSKYTSPIGINAKGEVVGTFEDINGVWHGFLRKP